MTAESKAFYKVDEFANRLEVSKWAVYDAVKNGQIRAVRIGRAVRIPATELERLASGA